MWGCAYNIFCCCVFIGINKFILSSLSLVGQCVVYLLLVGPTIECLISFSFFCWSPLFVHLDSSVKVVSYKFFLWMVTSFYTPKPIVTKNKGIHMIASWVNSICNNIHINLKTSTFIEWLKGHGIKSTTIFIVYKVIKKKKLKVTMISLSWAQLAIPSFSQSWQTIEAHCWGFHF